MLRDHTVQPTEEPAMTMLPCRCPCHVSPTRDIHVSALTGAVLWCCHAPFAQPAPMVPPTPMFSVEVIEVKPMEMPIGMLFHLDLQYKRPAAGQPYVEEDPYDVLGGEA